MTARTAVLDIAVDEREVPAARGGLVWTAELATALHRLRLGRGPAVVRISGALGRVRPAAGSPESAVDDSAPDEGSPEFCLTELANALGTPYGYDREHEGALIQQIIAAPGAEGVASSTGSQARLPFHTENSFAETRPDFVVLLCRRRGPSSVPTLVCDVGEVTSRLSGASVETLSRPLFEISSPASFGEPSIVTSGVPVLEQSPAGAGMRVDLPHLLTADSPEAKEALADLFTALEDAGTPVTLEEGEFLIIDNRRAAHARPGFTATFDDRRRWLQRSLVRVDFWGCRSSVEREGVRVRDGVR